MAKYRKKPVMIDAVQLTEELFWKMYDKKEPPLFGGLTFSGSYHPVNRTITNVYIVLSTRREGLKKAEIGDWIIKDTNGDLFPCKPDIFEKTYEPV